MLKLNCIIVEDEPIAAEILASYILETPFLQLTHTCTNAIEALEVVHNQQVDVIFLDIHLPKLNGIEFIKTLRKRPKIIIISAHHEFAVEGFELQVTDYLLKPVDFARFTMAAQKLLQLPKNNPEPSQHFRINDLSHRPYYFFTVNKRAVKIFLDEILFIESIKDSVIIVTRQKTYSTHYLLGELEELICSDNFLRIHRSFLVAVDKIESFSASEVEIAGRSLPIGRSFKNFVAERLGR